MSFYVIERPIRQGTLLTGWRTWAITPLAVLGTVAAFVAATSTPPVPRRKCRFLPSAPLDTGPPVRALVVGDSTATDP